MASSVIICAVVWKCRRRQVLSVHLFQGCKIHTDCRDPLRASVGQHGGVLLLLLCPGHSWQCTHFDGRVNITSIQLSESPQLLVTVQAVEKDGVKVQEKVKSHLHRGNCKAMHRYNWSQTSIDAATKGTSFPFKHILVSKFPKECTYPCAGTGYQLNSLPRPTSHLRCSTLASALRNLLTITVHAPQPHVKTFKHLTFEEMVMLCFALLLDPSVGWGTWQVEPCLKCFWSPPSPHPSLVPHNLNFVLEILIDDLSMEDIICKSFVVNQVLIWT